MKLIAQLLITCCLVFIKLNAQPTKIYLNPKASVGGNQSLFIDSIKIHPLEKIHNIQLGNYSNLIVAPKYFLLVNYIEKIIYIYATGGAFIKKISYKNLGTEVYPKYDKAKDEITFFTNNKNYTLTEKDQIKIKTDFANKKNRKYYKKYMLDLKDTALTLKKAEPKAFDILNAYNLKDNYYCTYQIAVNKTYKDTIDYEVKIYENTNFIKGYFPYNKSNEKKYLYAKYISAVTQESGKPDTFYITRPYNDTIYSLANYNIIPAYQVILPMENSLPKTFFTNTFKNATERENYERNNGWMMRQIYEFRDMGRFIYMSIGFFTNYGSYLYDKKTGISYNTNKIKPDSLHYNLPIIKENFGYVKNNTFYSVVTPDELKKVLENQNASSILPEVLKNCAADKKNTCPLIVEYVFKNN